MYSYIQQISSAHLSVFKSPGYSFGIYGVSVYGCQGETGRTHAQGLADHHGAPKGKEGADDMHLSAAVLVSPEGDDAEGHIRLPSGSGSGGGGGMGVPALGDPPGHGGGEGEGGGDGEALKVL